MRYKLQLYASSDPTLKNISELLDLHLDLTPSKNCHGGGKGGGGGGTTVQSSNAPPPQVMAAYQSALSAGQSAASQPLQQYNSPIVAGFSPDQLTAFQNIAGAQNIQTPYINQAQQQINAGTAPLWSGTQQFSPDAISQYQSPYTSSVLNSTMAAEQNQDQQQQAALQGNAISSGAWGGDRAGVASAILSGQQDVANNATNANIENTGYNTALGEFNTQQQAQLGANEANSYLNEQAGFGNANLGSEAQSLALSGANQLGTAGNQEQALSQSILNVPYQQYTQSQAYPFQTAQYFSNIAEGIGSNSGGVGSSTTTPPAPSTLSQVGGLALGGLGLAAGAFGNRGGNVNAFRRGGVTGMGRYAMGGRARPQFAVGGVPDLSVDFIPGGSPALGKGPPQAQSSTATGPAPPQASGINAGSLLAAGKGAKALYNWANSLGDYSGDAFSGAAGATTAANTADFLAPEGADVNFAGTLGGANAGFLGGGAGAAGAADAGSAGAIDSSLFGATNASPFAGLATSLTPDFAATDLAGVGLGGAGLDAAGLGAAESSIIPDIGAGFAGDALGAGAGSAAADLSFSDVFDAIASFFAFKKGGAVKGMGARPKLHGMGRYDVGGATPMTTAAQGQQMPTQSSQLNNLTVAQLQQLIMRLPIGGPQAQAAQQMLQQKKMMPNVGAQATGGFGSQQPQPQQMGMQGSLARGGMARRGFDDGGMVDNGIYIPNPAPPAVGGISDNQMARIAELGDMPTPTGGMARGPGPVGAMPAAQDVPVAPVDQSQMQQPAAKQEYEPDLPDSDFPNGSENKNSRAPAKANPWLALAKAGFAMAGGTSPYAMVNIGRGAEAGLNDYQNQQKEADSVNEAADKLMNEAAQHKGQLAIDQQKADQEGKYQTGMLGNDTTKTANEHEYQQGELGVRAKEADAMNTYRQAELDKPEAIKDMYGNVTGFAYPRSGSFKPLPDAAKNAMGNVNGVIPGPDGKPLSGQPYLDALSANDPTLAAQVKSMDEGDLNFPTGFAAKAPYWQQRLNALYQYNPQASQQTAAAVKNFNIGPQGNQTRYLNVATSHLSTLDGMVGALDNGDVQAFNKLGQAYAAQTGSAAPTNFNTVKNIVGNEVTKAVVGAGGTGEDRAKAQEVIDNANSPEQLKGAISSYLQLMSGQLGGLRQQYTASTRRNDFDEKYLTPEARRAISSFQIDGQGSAGGNVPPQAAIDMLKKNPALAPAFEQKYGVPASQFTGGGNGP